MRKRREGKDEEEDKKESVKKIKSKKNTERFPSLPLTFCVCVCVSPVDGSTAGSGNLEILVNGGHVTSYVRNLGQQRFLASFVPHSAIRHVVEMRFNGEKVPGESTLCQANGMRG